MILETIHDPRDIKTLNDSQTQLLCTELREFLLKNVSKTGGHLASNLGAVELTVAIHRVFDTSRDRLVFDVGHQCYTHKILTGRREQFSSLRQYGGLSGFPKPRESGHDAFIAGHASNSVSVALGMARARTLQHQDYSVLALIGDGALSGGLAYEGLNNAGSSGEPLIVILNDNGMSIDGNVGAVSEHLGLLRSKPAYYEFKKAYRDLLDRNAVGRAVYDFNHHLKTNVKKALLPNSTMFEDMGFTYLGPVNGHDVGQLTNTLKWAKDLNCPVLVHVHTKKGKGYPPAEREPERYHGVGKFDPRMGVPREHKRDFSAVFGDELCKLAKNDETICAITAAMRDGTGLHDFSEQYPVRFFDVGIAEGHAVAMAAGMAKQGLTPVVAIYSSFLQRAYDQLIHDTALSDLHVVFAVDRAGMVGADGETHHGIFDATFLSEIPNMTVLCPSNFAELRTMLDRAVNEIKGPVAIRYPRGNGAGVAWRDEPFAAMEIGRGRCLKDGERIAVLTIGTVGNFASEAIARMEADGIRVAHYDLRFAKPLDQELLHEVGRKFRCVVTVEDGALRGGVGEAVVAFFCEHGYLPKVVSLGIPDRFVEHGTPAQLYAQCGYDAEGIYRTLKSLQESLQ